MKAYPYSEMLHHPRYDWPPNHLVILGSCLPSEERGLCIVSGEPSSVRDFGVHSASAGMALPVLAQLAKAIADHYGADDSKLHPYFREIAANVRSAAELLTTAAALDNPERREELYQQNPI